MDIRHYRDKISNFIRMRSLEEAARAQGLDKLKARLKGIVPDISEQYSSFRVDNAYLETKVRNMHAFQISLVSKIIDNFKEPVIVDIGDSSGAHLQYLRGLYSGSKKINSYSVNLDAKAVERIKKKNLPAMEARAEDLHKYNVNADIFLCFELLEHLMDPCHFLYQLSIKTSAKYMIITVPYLKNSRVGMHSIRAKYKKDLNAENTHIFELSPKDWKLLFQFAGWGVEFDNIYLQYPSRHWLWLTKFDWRRFDFEGFYGAILTRDHTWCNLYKDF